DAATVFSLSVKDTDELFEVRAQPSGTRTTKPPRFDRYGTNCVLSGMSPGGLLSAGTGDSTGTGLGVAEARRVAEGAEVLGDALEAEVVVGDELHDAATTA